MCVCLYVCMYVWVCVCTACVGKGNLTLAPRRAHTIDVDAPIPWPSSGGFPAPQFTMTLPSSRLKPTPLASIDIGWDAAATGGWSSLRACCRANRLPCWVKAIIIVVLPAQIGGGGMMGYCWCGCAVGLLVINSLSIKISFVQGRVFFSPFCANKKKLTMWNVAMIHT